jgi:nucleoside-diphosphate-sugar epimerase
MWFGNHLQADDNLTIVKGDIRDIDSVPMEGINKIIHLANVANDPCGDLNAKLVWEVNVLASRMLMEKAIEHGVDQFIYASSGSVYGIKDEEEVTEELSLVPISDYNKTKMISERVLLSYTDKIAIQIIRPATVCGISDRMRLDVSVNLLTAQAAENGKITVFGGSQVRPNIHIQDLTDVFIHFLAHGSEFTGLYNAGFENISILEIAQMVAKKIEAEIVVTESNDPRCYRLNSDKLLNTGFKPRHTVGYAIEEIGNAIKNNILQDDIRWHNVKSMKNLTEL